MSLIPINNDEIEIGKPLPWDIHDQHNHLLMAQGDVIATTEQMLTILESNPCRELAWEPSAGSGAARMPQVEEFNPNTPPTSLPETQLKAAAPSAKEKTGKDHLGSYSFDDMRLKVGDQLQIQPPALLSAERFMVRLVGYVKNVSLLVTAPFARGLRLPLKGNEKLVVRVFTSQNAFGFNCDIIKMCKLPFEYLHLSFPTEVQGAVVRKAPRVRTRIITTVTNTSKGDGTESASGIISNISATGALVVAHRNMGKKGDILNLAFRVNLHDIDAYLTTKAVICTVFADEPVEGSGAVMIHHGTEFTGLLPNDSVILQSLIYQHMIEFPHTMM